jgi:hypothetical protein
LFNNWIISLIDIFGKHFNDVMIAIIIFLSIFWFIKYDIILLAKLTRSLRNVASRLSTIEFNRIDSINEMNNVFEEQAHPSLKKLWADYYDDFRSIAENEKSPDLLEYFNMSSMVTVPAFRKKTEVIPGTLTGIGILGTILEIVAGLKNTFTSVVSTAPYNDQQFFNIIISAFSIAILSIILSIIFQYADRQLYHKAMTEVSSFISTLSHKIPVSNTTGYFHILLKEQRSQTVILQKMVGNISGNFNRLIGNDLIPVITRAFENSINNQIVPPVESMRKTVLQLAEIAMENQTEMMQKIIDNFVNNMNTSLSGQFETLGKSIHNSVDALTKTKENLDLLIMELIKSIGDQREINSNSGLIAGTIAQYHTEILKSNINLAESLERLNHFSGTLSEAADTSRELLEGMAEQQLKFQQENNNYFMGMLEHMDTQVRNTGMYTKEITDGIGELNWRLGDTVREFNDQVHSGLERTFNDFDAGLGEICMRLSGTITLIKDSIDDLPLIFSELKDNIASTGENEI